jgi:hypothetical protein
MTRYRTAHPKRVVGWVALAEKAYSEAYRLLAESAEGYREDAIDHEYIAISLAALGRD